MSLTRFLESIVVVVVAAHQLCAGSVVTYAVGPCKPTLPSFSTISAALAASPAPNIVMVCPGTYNEQVQITQPVTLQGIISGNSGQPIIAVPSGGLVTNATEDMTGSAVAAQVWVNNTSGPVNISNLTVDATGNGINCECFVVGMFFQNSPGIVNHVTTRNQAGNNLGVGIWTEGGSSDPTVTVENSSVHSFDDIGIVIQANSLSSALTTTVKGNDIADGPYLGIYTAGGTTSTVTNNVIQRLGLGILTANLAGAVSGNTLSGIRLGIQAYADEVSLTGNRILGSSSAGIELHTSLAPIHGNTISHVPVGIDFICSADGNVHSNTIIDATTGLDHVPAGITTVNSYFSVATIRNGC